MAVAKIKPLTSKTYTASAIKKCLDYYINDEKTNKGMYVDYLNCSDNVVREFMDVRCMFGNKESIVKNPQSGEKEQAFGYSGYFSFEGYEVNPSQAIQIAREVAEDIWGDRFQCVLACHTNTKNVHVHFMINYLSCLDGKTPQGKESEWRYIKGILDNKCREHGLSVIQKSSKHNSYYYDKEKKGEITPYYVMRKAFDKALAQSCNLIELKDYLHELGYVLDTNEKHKYWSITPLNEVKSDGKPRVVRLYKLDNLKRGDSPDNPYMKENILNTLENHRLYGLDDDERDDKFKAAAILVRRSVYKEYSLEDRLLWSISFYRKVQFYVRLLEGVSKQDPARYKQITHYVVISDIIELDKFRTMEKTLSKFEPESKEDVKLALDRFEEELENNLQELRNIDLLLKRKGVIGEERVNLKSRQRALKDRNKVLRQDINSSIRAIKSSEAIENAYVDLQEQYEIEKQTMKKEEHSKE